MNLRRPLAAAPYLLVTAGFALLSAGLPAGPAWSGWMPDLTPVLLLHFVLHRPDRVPAAAVVAAGLFADLLYGRIPGTGALALLVTREVTCRWRAGLRPGRLPARALLVVAGATLHAVLLALLFFPAAGVSPLATLLQALATALAYPLTALFLRHVLRFRAAPRPALVG